MVHYNILRFTTKQTGLQWLVVLCSRIPVVIQDSLVTGFKNETNLWSYNTVDGMGTERLVDLCTKP